MRVLIVDDHPVVVSGCRSLLAGEPDVELFDAGDAETGFSLFQELNPSVTVIDINLPGVSGFELARRILRKDPDARIVIFTMNDDAHFASRALECGAKGYVTKTGDPLGFVEALKAVASGREYLPPDIARQLAFKAHSPANKALGDISGRELEIMQMLSKGRSLAEIAHELSVSYKTIANACAILKRKVGARTTGDLVRMAVEFRLG
ncbi:MAG TPA: response regulator transcription factor [Rhodoblastus sp.]|nr:response regulator transcription factor [Rhodoblastus sp.]